MNTTPRFFALTSLVLALSASASFAQSQAKPVTVRSSRTEAGSVAPGGVFTAPFVIVNTTSDSLPAAQVLTLPAGWSAVNSMAPAVLAPNAMELWLVSIAAPASAPAGVYTLRAGIRTGGAVASDSLVVTVEERYVLEIRTTTTPAYVMTGESYEAQFIVRNRGNVSTRVALKATSNHGSTPKLSANLIDLAPGATSNISATVAVPAGGTRTIQDLLEVIVVDAQRDSVRAEVSVETTIIARNDSPEFWTVPGELSFRAATAGAGISPIVASGTGRISETRNTSIDYTIRSAAAGKASIFGERDEYRLAVRSQNVGIRLGDESFGFSTLTSAGSQGTGGELRGTRGRMIGGAYVQRSRFNPNAATEVAATIGTSAANTTAASLILLQRAGAGTTARVLGGSAQTTVFGANVEVEAAQSDSQQVGGTAAMVRIFGTAPTFTYDVGGQRASGYFAGAQRASSDRHVTLSGYEVGMVTLSAMTATHAMNPSGLSNGFGQTITTSSLSGSFKNGSAIEFERFDRTDFGTTQGIRGNQQALKLRGRMVVGSVDLLGTLQGGAVAQADSGMRAFGTLSGSARTTLGRDQYVSAFGEMTDGRTLGGGGVGTVTGGASADLRLPKQMTLRLTTSATAQRDRLADWVGQADITVERHVRQSIVALRGRLSQASPGATQPSNAFYVEVRTPLRMPTSRLNLGGRARAQVVDAETGKGVAGALVRMGEQAAITDKSGNASFKGLETGEYHATVEGGITAGQMVTGGDVKVVANSRPSFFTMNVARGARVAARIRRFEKNVAVPDGADSIVDAGAIGQAVVALISSRDTIWQSSDDRGRIDFGSVAPGRYTLKIVASDLPEYTEFETKQIDLNLVAGEVREVELRAVPQTRTVEFVGSETVLVAAPAAQPATRVESRPLPRPVAPNPTRNQQKQNDRSRNQSPNL